MPRKSAGTLAEQRAKVEIRYKRRGKKRSTAVTSEDNLSEVDRKLKQEIACYLKAQDFSYSYIADALGVGQRTVQRWFSDEELDLPQKVAKIRADLVTGAVEYLKTYLLEVIEILMQIMRETDSDKLAADIGFEILDRLGITKVNKSESAVTTHEERTLNIADKTGILGTVASAPPEVQSEIAQKLEDAFAMVAEHAAEEPAPAEVTNA